MFEKLPTDLNIYRYKQMPVFEGPKVIGFINLKSLKFAKRVCKEKVNYNLNLLYKETEHRSQDVDLKITELLRFLLHNSIRLNFPLESALMSSKFFCNRGALNLIATTPYHSRASEPWKIQANLHKGDIYLCVRDTEEKTKRIQNMTEKDKQYTAWGHKFEQFVLSDSPESEPNPMRPVEDTDEFSLVFQAKLLDQSIVYRAEIDGLRCDGALVPPPPAEGDEEAVIKYLSQNKFIELKTLRRPTSEKQQINFRRFKILKWWCQTYFSGISDVLCGYRNDDGIVDKLDVFPVSQLPKLATVPGSKSFWRPEVCLHFLNDFLIFVKKCLAAEIKREHGKLALKNLQSLPMISLMFDWKPNSSGYVQLYWRPEVCLHLKGFFIFVKTFCR